MRCGVRTPCVAGQFYESNPDKLNEFITKIATEEAETPPAPGKVRAVILPHAGYVFSAKTAIKTLQAADCNYKRVLLLAPSHRVAFRGLAASEFNAYRTPLGDVPVAKDALDELLKQPETNVRNLPEAQQYEHSLEVELPLLQYFYHDFEIIPLIVGHINPSHATSLAELLTKWWEPDTLWVISSDFTHYGRAFNYLPFRENVREQIEKLDMTAVDYILKQDLTGFDHFINSTGATICGAGPIEILLAVLRHNNTSNEAELTGKLIHYTTSGELTGDFTHCVSYAGILFHE